MAKLEKRLILDCTLRDGGYVNNWEFDTETVLAVRDALYKAGIWHIELGIMGKGGEPGKNTKFSTFEEIKPLLSGRQLDCHYYVMVTQADYAGQNMEFPVCGVDTVDAVRLAYFKPEMEAALDTAQRLKEKGYSVFLQAMATFMYGNDELSDLIERVNELKPTAFYMVDSFSTMYNEDVRAMKRFVLERLDEEISFGFHAHNNIQMAYSNAVEFVDDAAQRTLMIDGSIFGMGRGAGNVPTELLMEYMNKKMGGQFNTSAVLDVFAQRIEPIFEEYYWGYSMPYLLTASKNLNSVYGWYLNRKGITDLADINAVLSRIPEEAKYTLMRDVADQVIAEYIKEKNYEQGNV